MNTSIKNKPLIEQREGEIQPHVDLLTPQADRLRALAAGDCVWPSDAPLIASACAIALGLVMIQNLQQPSRQVFREN